MPPKKKGGADKKAGNGELEPGEDPLVVLSNYQRFSKLISIPVNSKIVAQLQDDENYPITQLTVDDEAGPLGPGGTRALMTALLGSGQDMRGGPYKLLKSLRMWRTKSGDEGMRSIAELLRLGGGEVKLEYLELFDIKIGPKGASALGQALSTGCNQSLLTLKLDCNLTLGSEGVANLCNGLRTNSTLKQLHLPYCNATKEAGAAIGEMLSFSQLALTLLNLQGNRLEADGVLALSPGLARNRSLTFLSLADNGVFNSEQDAAALEVFRNAMMACPTLTHIDLLYNRIGERGAHIMLPALVPENTQIKHFLVDATLPTPLFEQLHRRDAGGGKKKKKGKKK